MADKIVFTGVGKMTLEDASNFAKLFQMNQIEAELANDKTVKTFRVTIVEEEE